MTAIVPKHAAKSKVLESISPSSITQFDATTPFGCERRWWFKYALGNPEPQDPSMLLGEALHKRNEVFLMTGEVPEAGALKGKWSVEQDKKAHSLFEKGLHVLKELRGLSFLRVEQTMPEGYEVGGLRVSSLSKCDVVTSYGIIDWKTTSDIDKYGKTPGQLANDTQMLIYARAFHPTAPKVRLIHGQYQTKGRERFHMPAVDVSRQQLDDRYGGYILPLVERMKSTYLVPAAKEVKPNRDACWRCPHKGICPPDKENPLMGVFSKFKAAVGNTTPSDAPASDPKKAAAPVEPAPGDSPAVAAKVRKMRITDVEEPKTHPAHVPGKPAEEEDEVAAMERKLAEAKAKKAAAEKAAAEAAAKAKAEAEAKAKQEAEAEEVDEADLVEEPETTEVKKRGPGRPPGAKNKATLEREQQLGTRFTKTTVSFGVTMNLGDYNSVRIDCSHVIDYSDGDADAAFAIALKKAKEQVEGEAERIQAELQSASTKK